MTFFLGFTHFSRNLFNLKSIPPKKLLFVRMCCQCVGCPFQAALHPAWPHHLGLACHQLLPQLPISTCNRSCFYRRPSAIRVSEYVLYFQLSYNQISQTFETSDVCLLFAEFVGRFLPSCWIYPPSTFLTPCPSQVHILGAADPHAHP